MQLLLLLPSLAALALASVQSNFAPLEVSGEASNSGSALSPAYYAPRNVFLVNGSSTTATQPSTLWASAIYTMSNSAEGNVLYAIAINQSSGSVNSSAPVMTYPLGGNGARFPFTGTTFQDSLDSQGSIVSAGARLFAVNAGSNTFQTFAINCTNATDLVKLGGPVQVNGNNPTTLAVARMNQIVCVATTGNVTGIECYTYQVGVDVSESNSPPQFFTGTQVSLPLPVAQEGALPTGPADTVSQLLFTDDEKFLVAVVKGAADSSGVISGTYINMYPIGESGLGEPVQSTPKKAKLLFGCTFIYDTYNLFCADAGVGAILLNFDNSTNKFEAAKTTNTTSFGNGTNCWAQRSPFANGPNYIDAVDKDYIAAFNKSTGQLTNGAYSQHNFTTGNPNLIEMATANNFVYALSFGNATHSQHITIARDVDLKGTFSLSQNYQIPGVTDNVSGMAAFINDPNSNTCDFV